MPKPTSAQIAAVRRFNRFYTARARILDERHLGSAFSLAEVRLLFELAHRRAPTASDLCRDLRLDAGYVSRTLRDFTARRLVKRTTAKHDRRQSQLSLTAKGRKAIGPLERQAADSVRDMLAELAPAARAELIAAMARIETALTSARPASPALQLRPPHPGDLGWVVQRHGELYAREFGYDERFEALVATIVGDFVANFVPDREACWIAELGGERVGSVFLVQKSETVAKLRLLLVEPSARGHGIGAMLVRACTTFARAAGYEEITLWTQSELTAARAIYVKEGYTLGDTREHAEFGKPCVAETWSLRL